MDTLKARICELSALAYDRRLLDSAGGNFSARLGNQLFMTPRYSGSRRFWKLVPDDIVEMDLLTGELAAKAEVSREVQMHLGIYRAMPEAQAVCHAHAINALAFAYLRLPLAPASEQTEKYGIIELTEEAPAHSEALAVTVVDTLQRKQELLSKHAIGCLIPNHGLVTVGRSIEDAYDALERIDQSAYVHLAAAALNGQIPTGTGQS